MSITSISSNYHWLSSRAAVLQSNTADAATTQPTEAPASTITAKATQVVATASKQPITGQYMLSGSTLFAAQAAGQLSDIATTQLPDGVKLQQFSESIDPEAMRSQVEAARNAEARASNPFHDVQLPEGSIGLFQEHLPNIDLGGKMLAITFPSGTQRIDVAETASKITQDAKGNIIVPAGLKYQLIAPTA